MYKESISRDAKIMRQQDEMHDLKQRLIAGEVGTVPGNINPEYQISEHEKDDYVHVKVTNKHWQASTKSVLEESSVVMIRVTEFARRAAEGAFATYDSVEIVHDPTRSFQNPKIMLEGDRQNIDTDKALKLENNAVQTEAQRQRALKIEADKKAKIERDAVEAYKKEQADIATKQAAEQKIIDDKKAADDAAAQKIIDDQNAAIKNQSNPANQQGQGAGHNGGHTTV